MTETDIEKEIADINEKQKIIVDTMAETAAVLANQLNLGVVSDVRKHLADLGKLIKIYDGNNAAKTELLYRRENTLYDNLIYTAVKEDGTK